MRKYLKKLIKVFLIVSVLLNIYFLFYEQKKGTLIFTVPIDKRKISQATWKEGVELLNTKLKEKYTKLSNNNKVYFVNIWDIECLSCIQEIQFLDSLAGKLSNKVTYIFISDKNDSIINRFLKRFRYNVKNFIFINDMSDFVSATCNKFKYKTKIYPFKLIINKQGDIYSFSAGISYSSLIFKNSIK